MSTVLSDPKSPALLRDAPKHKSKQTQADLKNMSVTQFAELCTDVLEEKMHRVSIYHLANAGSDIEAPALPAGTHGERNRGRQKMALLPDDRFRLLIGFVTFEMHRRFLDPDSNLALEHLETWSRLLNEDLRKLNELVHSEIDGDSAEFEDSSGQFRESSGRPEGASAESDVSPAEHQAGLDGVNPWRNFPCKACDKVSRAFSCHKRARLCYIGENFANYHAQKLGDVRNSGNVLPYLYSASPTNTAIC
jgi:hypothetical protein